jgi:hypothetical protein
MGAAALFDVQLPHPKSPALDHAFTAAMAKGAFAGSAGNIAGIYISQAGL